MFVRALTDEERSALATGLRSSDGLVVRRSQMVLNSAQGERVPQIAARLGCDEKTVRQVVHRFNRLGGAAVARGSSRPHHPPPPAFTPAHAEELRALLHRTPRDFGYPSSLWTLELAAQVSVAQGLTATLVSAETVRLTLKRLGIRWKRAKQWITSPDPEYARKKVDATG